jgi:1,4-alpha-glucan branching enzyme
MAFKMSDDSRTTLEHKTPESNKSVKKDSMAIPDAGWREVCNSDAAIYGGQNIGNFGGTISSHGSQFAANIPANGFVVFVKQ